MKSFLLRLSLFVIIPFTVLLTGYICFDPFKVIYDYDDYSKTFVILNRDYVSTTQYLKNKEKYHYDSYILGSSRTIAYKAATWRKYLGKDAAPFTFDAAAESIYGIHGKLKYMDAHNAKIDNALIVLCRDWMSASRGTYSGHLFKKHPEVSGRTWINFHFTMFKAYMDSKFLLAYYNYKFTGEFKPWMAYIITRDKFFLDPVTNEMDVPLVDKKINDNPRQHVIDHDSIFYERKGEKLDSIDRLDDDAVRMLTEMKQILEKHKTKYKIVASPLYDQVKFSKHDKDVLVKLFGPNFYDYTGKNKFTDNKENYYETSHFRPNVGAAILKEIYQDEKQKPIVK
jgi:hypothetical protein